MPDQSKTVVRVPLVGTAFGRPISSSTNTSSASGIVGIGIVGVMIVGLTSFTTKDQHFINAIPERITDPVTGQHRFYVTKRPGWAINSTPSAGNIGSAIHVWSGRSSGTDIWSAFGTPNSTVFLNTTNNGSTTAKVLFIDDTLIGTVPNATFVTNNNSAY